MRQKRMKESNNLLIENNDEDNEKKAGKSSGLGCTNVKFS
jgi:hypothetical protein